MGARTTDVTEPRISVVTVVCNAADALERTIASVAAQSYSNLEYVIVDGGSTDGTVDVIRRHEAHVDRWITEPDRGIYDAMNKGVGLSSGAWVNFLNAGDCLSGPDVIGTVAAGLGSEATFVYGDFEWDAGDQRRPRAYPDRVTHPYFLHHWICHQSVFAPRTLLVRERFDTSLAITADLRWVLGVLASGGFAERIPVRVCSMLTGGVSEHPRVLLERYLALRPHFGVLASAYDILTGGTRFLLTLAVRRLLGRRYRRMRKFRLRSARSHRGRRAPGQPSRP